MKRWMVLGLAGVVGVLGAACASTPEDSVGQDDQDIAIDRATENPAVLLGSDFDVNLLDVIPPGDEGKSFGLDDSRIPYPDTYWPFLVRADEAPDGKEIANGIDHRWINKDELSPLEKLMAATDAAKTADAKAWEQKNHGRDVRNVASWFGHCPGWTAAAMINAPLVKGASVKSEGGKLKACAKGSEGCTTFEVGDINALEAEVFADSTGGFIGARCDTAPKDIERDEHGRVKKSGCRGLNSGALLIVLANRMKNVKNAPDFKPKALAIDAQDQFNTDQIWNQPAYRYEVNEARAISEADAIRLTHKPSSTLPTKYPFNSAAKGFYKVDVGIKWVQENGPNMKFVSGALSTKTMRFAAVIELDGDPKSPTTNIIGGEFLDDPSVGANRLIVPPFVWTAETLRPDNAPHSHNPFVKGSLVQELVNIALAE